MDSLTINQKQPHVVFIPFPIQSHIKCMLKLAKVLHQKGIHITFINTPSNHKRLIESGGIRDLNGAPGFQFKTVPEGPCSVASNGVEYTPSLIEIMTYLATNLFDSFLDLVSGLETPVTCIICDGFMTYTNMINAAERLKIPIILFWTVAACGFMSFYQVKVLVEKGLVPLKDETYLTNGYLDMNIDWIPGMEGIRLKDLPEFMSATKLNNIYFQHSLKTAEEANKVLHMIIHTFEELEASVLKEITSIVPNIYSVGPLELLLNQKNEKTTFNGYSLWKEEPECLEWLQSKEKSSVLYVNFGSLAEVSYQELIEFGWGLVNSNHEFLWIIRRHLVDGKPCVLPQELKEAMKTKGFVAEWCSQEEVLNHPSVGGFLTHGGWGSIIESLSAGVPMICYPFLGDQRMNTRQMCVNWGVGIEIERNVKRDDVEKLVKMLIEGEEGSKIRKKAMEWKEKAHIATGLNGSSSLDIQKLANHIIRLSTN